jgi:hypothetical protein
MSAAWKSMRAHDGQPDGVGQLEQAVVEVAEDRGKHDQNGGGVDRGQAELVHGWAGMREVSVTAAHSMARRPVSEKLSPDSLAVGRRHALVFWNGSRRQREE